MKDELRKSLTDLIDETLLELEELQKSRFAASEIDVKGPGEGIAGKPSNGDLHAKAEDKDDDKDEDDKDEDDKDAKKAEDAEKAEGHNRQADPNGGHHQVDKAEGHNRQADPNGGHHKMDKAEDKDDKKKDKKDSKDKDDDKDSDDKPAFMKSVAESESLMKSFVEARVKPLEDKLATILNLVNKIAEQPVAPKGATARTVPLFKSNEDGGETLSKADVASKLFDLKKSGTKVDSLDITRAEMGHDLAKIVAKYNIS